MSVGVVRADAFRVLNNGWAWERSHSVCRKPQTWRWYERPGGRRRVLRSPHADITKRLAWLAARSPIKLLRKRSTEFRTRVAATMRRGARVVGAAALAALAVVLVIAASLLRATPRATSDERE
jgi:hypothetical protein